MAFRRFYPVKDTFITNKIVSDDGGARATGSNLGGSPTLEIFKVTSSFPNEAAELSHVLLQFDTAALSGMVFNDNVIPQTSASWILKCFNYSMANAEIPPQSFDISACSISASWDEGIGIDNTNFIDYGYCNWLSASSTSAWISGGGDYLIFGSASQHFDDGTEDLEIDVTNIVQSWQSSSFNSNGILLKLGDAEESNNLDYYRKMFYSVETQTVENIPYLEARWTDATQDNRGNFYFNNNNLLYLYNVYKGFLKNALQPVYVRVQNNYLSQSCSFQATYTASYVSPGIYVANINVPGADYTSLTFSVPVTASLSSGSTSGSTGSFSASMSGSGSLSASMSSSSSGSSGSMSGSSSGSSGSMSGSGSVLLTQSYTVSNVSFVPTWLDIWSDASGTFLMSGTFNACYPSASSYDQNQTFNVSPGGLKRVYKTNEKARIYASVSRIKANELSARHTSSAELPCEYIENMYYSVVNNDTGETVVPFGTGSNQETKLSYNYLGNYFNMDINSFVPGFVYRLQFLINYSDYESTVIDQDFIFKVV